MTEASSTHEDFDVNATVDNEWRVLRLYLVNVEDIFNLVRAIHVEHDAVRHNSHHVLNTFVLSVDNDADITLTHRASTAVHDDKFRLFGCLGQVDLPVP